MQFFELLLVISSLIYVIFYRRFNRRVDKKYLIFGLILVLLGHLIIEGYRLQMIPAYVLWIVAMITTFRGKVEASSMPVAIIKGIGLFILSFIAIILPTVLPVFDLPVPTGKYAVGTSDLEFWRNVDEEITEDTDDSRKLMLKVWYPSDVKEEKKDVYVDKGGRNGFAQKYGLPNSFLDYLDKVDTHVFKEPAAADGSFPVLIFSHGYNSKANGYYSILSELASHGYVIFALNHTYESTGTTFADDSEAYFDYNYAQKIESGTWETISPAIELFHNGTSFKDRHPKIKKALKSYFVKDIVDRWANDIVAVSNNLGEWNSTGILEGRLDLKNIGVLGHSRGGGAAGHSLLKESPIKAGVNLDGVQWGKIVDTTFQKPFLFLSADWPEEHEDLNSHAYINKGSKFYSGTLLQSAHSNFMDIPFMIPVKALSQAGTIDPVIAIQTTNKVLLDFFNQELKGNPMDLKRMNSENELLEIQFFDGVFDD